MIWLFQVSMLQKGAMGIYRGDRNIKATIHYSSYTFDEKKNQCQLF